MNFFETGRVAVNPYDSVHFTLGSVRIRFAATRVGPALVSAPWRADKRQPYEKNFWSSVKGSQLCFSETRSISRGN